MTMPPSASAKESVGRRAASYFIAHIPTSAVDVRLSPDIHPQILHFTSRDLYLNSKADLAAGLPASGDFACGRERLFSGGDAQYSAPAHQQSRWR